jgi:hypothetical protein
MKDEEKIKSLVFFQSNCFKAHRSLGFNADNANAIFGIIIEMRNIVVAAENQDTILLHKHMGLCSQALSDYATINSIKLSDILINTSHEEMTYKTQGLDLEFYLEKIKDDLSFVKDMSEDEKIEFIQKTWVCIFPENYHDDFIKVDRILKSTIKDNQIKYPKLFS